MGKTSKAIAELDLAQVTDLASPSDLIVLASILVKQFENNYSGLREFDDHDCLGRIFREIEQLANSMEVAKAEAEEIEKDREYQSRLYAIRRGYDFVKVA